MKFHDAAINAGLQPQQGKQAVKNEYRSQINVGGDFTFTGSADLDQAFIHSEPNSHRWDYVVGFKNSLEFVIWIEPHPANSAKDIDTVLRKLSWLKGKLKTSEFSGLCQLTDNTEQLGIIPYRWTYSGKSKLRVHGKQKRRLTHAGMKLPERWIQID